MEYITTIIILFLVIASFYLCKNKFSLIMCFHMFWLLICFFSIFKFYDMYEVSDKIYNIVLIGNISFFIGSVCYISKGINNRRKSFEITRKKSFMILLIFALIIVFYKIILMLPIILSNGIGYARDMMQVEENMNLTGFWLTLQMYFAKPFLRASVILLLVEMVNNKITLKKIMSIIFITFVSFMCDGGRTTIIYVVVATIYLLFINRNKLTKHTKTTLKISISLLILMTFYYTLERQVNLIENFYTYYCGSLVYFSKNMNNSYLYSDFLYGLNSFQGITRPIFGVLNILGVSDPTFLVKSNDFLMGVQQTVVYVSPNIKMNYFITCFGYFYKDFGMFGVVLISFVFGFICKFIDNKEYYSNNLLWCSLKILFLQGVLFTMSRFIFSDYNFVMSSIYICIFSIQKKHKIKVRFSK